MANDKWDFRYLRMAKLVASWSKDPNSKVGAVIIRQNRVVASGFNGFPQEVRDTHSRLEDSDIKLEMVVHAEINALVVAGRSCEGATIYVSGKPVCARCAGPIIQSGIKRVVAPHPSTVETTSKWRRTGEIAAQMFAEAGVILFDPIQKEFNKSASVRTAKRNGASKDSSRPLSRFE